MCLPPTIKALAPASTQAAPAKPIEQNIDLQVPLKFPGNIDNILPSPIGFDGEPFSNWFNKVTDPIKPSQDELASSPSAPSFVPEFTVGPSDFNWEADQTLLMPASRHAVGCSQQPPWPMAGQDVDFSPSEGDVLDDTVPNFPTSSAAGRECLLFDPGNFSVNFEDYLPMEARDDAMSDSGSSSQAKKAQRKRKCLADLSPLELLKTREINRLAAQRHRQLAKQKKMDQSAKLNAISQHNDALRREIQMMTAELNTLRKVVVSKYSQGGSARLKLPSFA